MTEPRFLEQLQELDAKSAAVREQEARGTAACADVRGVLDRLRVKVGEQGHPNIRTSLLNTAWRSLAEYPICCDLAKLFLTSLGSQNIGPEQ